MPGIGFNCNVQKSIDCYSVYHGLSVIFFIPEDSFQRKTRNILQSCCHSDRLVSSSLRARTKRMQQMILRLVFSSQEKDFKSEYRLLKMQLMLSVKRQPELFSSGCFLQIGPEICIAKNRLMKVSMQFRMTPLTGLSWWHWSQPSWV